MDKQEFQEIKTIGFDGLIEKFKKYTGDPAANVIQGIGDDTSVLKIEGTDHYLCTTTEIFLEGVHFDLTYTPFHYLGYKIVTATVSDLIAMNATPEQLLLSIAVPNKYSVQMIEKLYEGISSACKDYGIQLTGGDTTASHQILAISGTATGTVSDKDIIYRSGAQKKDLICVSGELGAAIAGLRVLMREKKDWEKNPDHHFTPELDGYEFVVKKQLVPVARNDLQKKIRESGIRPTSMIDVTQGLIHDLKAIGLASGVGIKIYSPAIPISLETRKIADEMKEDVDKYAFYGGEDFEILFTLKEHEVEKLKSHFEDFSVIGEITEKVKQLEINTGEDETIQIDIHSSA